MLRLKFTKTMSDCIVILTEQVTIPAFRLLTAKSGFLARDSTYLSCSFRTYCSQEDRFRESKMPGETCVLRYSKLTERARDPVRGTDYAAGFDLRSAYNYVVPAHGKELVKTDIQVQIPEGCYGRIAPRSGLAWKNFIDVGAGVIDVDYRGNIGVVIFNHGDSDFEIREGDRIAQLICEKIAYPSLEEVKNLDNTARGAGGFGSTGKN